MNTTRFTRQYFPKLPTPAGVVRLFEEHDIRPAPGGLITQFGPAEREALGACALGVISYDRGLYQDRGSMTPSQILVALELPYDVYGGIATGFDRRFNRRVDSRMTQPSRLGFAYGQAVRQLLQRKRRREERQAAREAMGVA